MLFRELPPLSRFHGNLRAFPVALLVAVLAGVLALAGFGGATPAQAEDLTQKKQKVDAKVDDANSEVLAFNKRVARATREVLDARAQQPSAQQNYSNAVAAKAEAEVKSTKARAALERATSDVLRAERRLDKAERRITDLESNVGDFARKAYQMGPFAELEMLLEAQDPADFTSRLAAIRTVSKSSNDALGELRENRADLSFSETKLNALRDNAVAQKFATREVLDTANQAAAGATAAKRIVDGLVEQEEAALTVAQNNSGEVKAQYAQLAAEQARIQAEIVAASQSLSDQTGVKTGTGGGKWLFPVAGAAIGSNAGWRFHPILHNTRCHAGSDISAPSGAPIMAVADGVVLQAGGNGGYGNYTVISHGANVTSAYAHQSAMSVSPGQSVKRGQVIGLVGSTGLSTGPHLHFEARVAGAPWNPRGWFGTGAKTPVCV